MLLMSADADTVDSFVGVFLLKKALSEVKPFLFPNQSSPSWGTSQKNTHGGQGDIKFV